MMPFLVVVDVGPAIAGPRRSPMAHANTYSDLGAAETGH
jgi:hypothetical protein